MLDVDVPDQCQKCGRYAEIGKHVALVCIHGEDIGRRWGTWEAMDEPERWRRGLRARSRGDLLHRSRARLRGRGAMI